MTPPFQTRILVADDELFNIEMIADMFKNDCEILFATNGEKAIQIAEQARPDVILLDVMMPVMDGNEACRLLKANPATRDIPVIFITAMTDESDEMKGFELGAVDYITKPFRPSVVRARVRTHAELSHSRRIIEQTSAQRREMLHVLCHDLVNPLGVISGMLDLIETFQDYELYKPHLAASAQNGLDIIEMVRSMQALETGKYPIKPVDLAEAIRQSCAMLQLKISAKRIRFELSVPDTLPVMAETTSLVNSVLNNLLTNAVKFSHSGGKIRIRAHPCSEETVQLSVRDYGIGMSPELCADLFDLKKSTSRPGTDGEQGTGFGMPLVRRFMKAYGGDILVHSWEASTNPNAPGTEIILTFPKAPACP